MKEIGLRLKKLRTEMNLTQVKLAEMLGIQQSRVNRYETGQSTPPPELFIRYADLFDVSMDYLYCRTDKPQGKLYQFEPKMHTQEHEQKEVQKFIEMCFDPGSPANVKLKAALIKMMTEEGSV